MEDHDYSANAADRPRRSYKKRKFCNAWLTDPEFVDWIEKDDTSEYKARCKICKRSFGAEITTLKRHLVSFGKNILY